MTQMAEKTEAFRRNLRQELRVRGITQGKLAEDAGISEAWLSEMLSGKASPSLITCERLANALGTSVEALIAERPPSSVKA